MNRGALEFHKSFVTEIMRFIQRQATAKENTPHVKLSYISTGLGIPQQDLKLICNIIRRKRYIDVKAFPNNDNEYWLTAAGLAHLAALDAKNRD